ncbi:MAG: Ig-like domain-containing protein [Cytophagales bacterium]|nr:Ig-like domain-containing protein [Cytophagales bacterium]
MKRILLLVVLSGQLFLGMAQKIEVRPNVEEINMKVEGTTQLEVAAFDESGKKLKANFYYYSSKGKIADVDEKGVVTGYEPGNGRIIVIARSSGIEGYGRADIPVFVDYSEPATLEINELPSELYTGVNLPIQFSAIDEKGFSMVNAKPVYESSNPEVATIDAFGNLQALTPGKTSISLRISNLTTTTDLTVKENPVSRLELMSDVVEVRTGDVIPFKFKAYGQSGEELSGIQPKFAFQGQSEDVSSYASGMIQNDGRFVADVAGTYTITAAFGNITTQKTIKAIPRNVTEKVQLIGKGAVSDVHTSDLWVWEGVDGRDYCVTGTWGGNGEAFFWDVTDPANMVLIDTITVDARTVNDVKVSEDGKICILSREGASNRKNGIVILDVTNPRDVKQISTYTDGLTGGVHNLFIYQNHVYALSNGERYDIINIEDPANPKKVGEFELETRGHSIHDVWVMDGIAYSSNWDDGVFMVDVGNGMAGGSPANPKIISSYAYPSGWNHAAFPYKDEQTGKFYVIGGDEAFPNGLHVDDSPTIPAGYLHFIDFTDMDNPKEVAKYEVPGAGSHNYWVDGDLLYVANYNAGLRVVDISGDLMGDLYRQGREVAWFLGTDPEGRIANAPMAWGPQPHKGHIFFSDWNSGLWAVKVETKKPKNTKIETR